ncbi:DNA-3-methyladenine glycosylase I [Aestuariibacter sp. AA17]|uniref:DNA-3-methyladenine glycosylase I n=1 Tax=Fluctibacter corallii TaxID=2984329 RepID=A0ABT3ACZ3_9ALTE|nr:DNA-3-methyladenine glycosylase I [Aestuariibacter sp. AA17]MCV2886551.1 DNA-3-methyladenine glycosylase I [Aestuariibacter sp. AA17]
MDKKRCGWVSDDALYQDYHDNVWGRPVEDAQELFAKLCLDGQQAGLSWITILKKQANYEALFHDFNPYKIAQMTPDDVERLMHEPGIVRNRLKIQSVIKNAHAFIKIENEGSFSDFLWDFVDHKTRVNQWRTLSDVPASTPESDAMAKALKKRGFSFVGTTICYAFMQAVGMVNDHVVDCHCYEDTVALAKR